MSDWINSNIENGVPPEGDKYTAIIENLDPKSVYEFRAYAMVTDVPIYGETKIAITKSPLPKVPTVVTGLARDVTASSMRLSNNFVSDIGSSNIIEYGVIYTQALKYGNEIGLVYDNSSTLVKKRALLRSINIDELFLLGGYGNISGLQAGVLTYYRAFAKNSEGIGYGVINQIRTLTN